MMDKEERKEAVFVVWGDAGCVSGAGERLRLCGAMGEAVERGEGRGEWSEARRLVWFNEPNSDQARLRQLLHFCSVLIISSSTKEAESMTTAKAVAPL